MKNDEKILEEMVKILMAIKMKYKLDTNFIVIDEVKKIIANNITTLVKTNILLLPQYINHVNKIFNIKKSNIDIIKKDIIKKNRPRKISYDNTFSELFDGEATEFDGFRDLIVNIINRYPIYYDNTINIWWIWNEKLFKWDSSNEEKMLCFIDSLINDDEITTKSNYKNETINNLKRVASEDKYRPFPPNENWIQFADKIVDIKTLKTYKPSPKFFITNIIPWELGNSKKTPVIDRLFDEWVVKKDVQDKSYIKTLYQITAYTMLSYGPLQKILVLTGSGANGKSTYIKILRKLFEKDNFNKGENIASTSIYDLTRPFGTSIIYKKLLGIISEVNSNEMKFTNTLKSLAGEDLILYEFKGKDAFSGVNTCTIVIASNTLPKTYDTTDGFYRKWLIVDFPNKFIGKKDIMAEIPDEEFNNLCFKSVTILNEMLKEGQFENEGDLENQIRRYESKSSPLNMFLQECCSYDLTEKMPLEDIVHWVNWFFDKHKIDRMPQYEIISFLKKEGYQFIKNTVKGIKLKDTNDIKIEKFRIKNRMERKIKEEKNKIEREKYFKKLKSEIMEGKISESDMKAFMDRYDEEKKEE